MATSRVMIICAASCITYELQRVPLKFSRVMNRGGGGGVTVKDA